MDELGYLSYGNRHADILFEVVTRRYEAGKPIVITTNKPFAEWSEVFPNASCVVTLVEGYGGYDEQNPLPPPRSFHWFAFQ